MKLSLSYLFFLICIPLCAQDICLTNLEKQVLQAINAHRQDKGLHALTLSKTLHITANKNAQNIVGKNNSLLKPEKFGDYKVENTYIRTSISGTTSQDITRTLVTPSEYSKNAKILTNTNEFAKFNWKTIGICIRTTQDKIVPTTICIFVGEKEEAAFASPVCTFETFFDVAEISTVSKRILTYPILKFKAYEKVSIYSFYIDKAGKRKKLGFDGAEANKIATVYLNHVDAVSYEVIVNAYEPTVVEQNTTFKITSEQKDTLWRTLPLEGNDLADVKKILQQGGNIDAKDDRGYTMLLRAARRDKAEIVEFLLEKGVNVNTLSNASETALAFTKSEKVYDLLMSKKINLTPPINPADRLTVLHSFASNGILKGVKHLVEVQKVNMEVNDARNGTPLFSAIMSNQVEVAQYLLQKGAKLSKAWDSYPIHEAVSLNNIKMIKLIFQHGGGVHLNLLDGGGYTPLHSYILKQIGDIEIVKLLVENGANVNLKTSNEETALQLCFDWEINKPIKEYLISKGAK